ncbi:hypothetical protein QOT17_020782 [Balamuthia mandrillaris]
MSGILINFPSASPSSFDNSNIITPEQYHKKSLPLPKQQHIVNTIQDLLDVNQQLPDASGQLTAVYVCIDPQTINSVLVDDIYPILSVFNIVEHVASFFMVLEPEYKTKIGTKRKIGAKHI